MYSSTWSRSIVEKSSTSLHSPPASFPLSHALEPVPAHAPYASPSPGALSCRFQPTSRSAVSLRSHPHGASFAPRDTFYGLASLPRGGLCPGLDVRAALFALGHCGRPVAHQVGLCARRRGQQGYWGWLEGWLTGKQHGWRRWIETGCWSCGEYLRELHHFWWFVN